MSTARSSNRSRLGIVFASIVVLFALVIGVIIGLTALFEGYTKTDGGEVAVVRNGGPLDNSRIRQIIQPGASRTWTGLYSKRHYYPSQARFYTITSDSKSGDKTGVDVVTVPSSDGVNLGIEGTIYFTLNQDSATLKEFDNKYGTRTFTGADGEQRHAYDGTQGWSAFLDQIIRPVIDNSLREQIGNFRCSDLQAACTLVQNNTTSVANIAPGQNNTNIDKVQQAVNQTFASDIKEQLGGDYLINIRFTLAKVSLPESVQDAVNKAQAAFASVTEAQANVLAAKADADANAERERGYRECPACAEIDKIKAIPPTLTTYATGSNVAVGTK